jgi:protein involved in polysaccharide export with SLBB domain
MTALASALALAALLIQSPQMSTQAAPAAPAPAVASPGYRVGPGDVIEVEVAERPELGRLATVQPTGSVRLPEAGEVDVAGLTASEIASRLARALAGSGEAPRVLVRVREAQSQFAWVRGAVARPGRKSLRGATRLIDALLDAGGLAATASGEIVVERPGGFPDGSRALRLVLPRSSPGPLELQQLALRLEPGDVVTAAARRLVAVSGAVRRPGRYPLAAGAGVSAAVAAAGGALAGAGRAVVRRREAGGAVREIAVDLDAVRRGRAADLELSADDEVLVGGRRP